jgi:hypothetical protein
VVAKDNLGVSTTREHFTARKRTEKKKLNIKALEGFIIFYCLPLGFSNQ